MSGVVSYDLFSSRVGGGSSGFTTEGGYYETFVNNTGAVSVKGSVVVASTAIDFGVSLAPINSELPVGIIYENGIANGSNVKVVVYGKAYALLRDTLASTRGYWCGVSSTTPGRMYQVTTPSAAEHYREIGHSLESKAAGVNVLSLIQVQFV